MLACFLGLLTITVSSKEHGEWPFRIEEGPGVYWWPVFYQNGQPSYTEKIDRCISQILTMSRSPAMCRKRAPWMVRWRRMTCSPAKERRVTLRNPANWVHSIT
ncbi:hypothetical protein F4823DRAFT_20285 [Ustulina deusta]|nr:hypothetical protein F4823DRAFT_20285 [Ustulina deusta]